MASSVTSPPHGMHILIIGAGVTGLLVAHGLKKAGIAFSVFESESSASQYRPREWSMGIHWALPQLEALLPVDLKEQLLKVSVDPSLDAPDADTMRIWNGKDGGILKEIPIPRTIRFSRRKLREFCTQGIDVNYGYKLSGIEYSDDKSDVTAIFANGERVTGSLIIGGDGPQSQVRGTLLGEKGETTPMEVVHTNIAVVYHDAAKARHIRSAHPVFSVAVHPASILSFISIQDIPDPEKPEDWRFQVVTSWPGGHDTSLDNAGRLAQLKEKGALLCEPFRSAVAWIPDDTVVTYDTMAYWVSIPWDNHDGRVTLAGDAAHPMTPHRGQGLNHAICDVSNFVAAMTKVRDGQAVQSEAISSYDDEVVKRGAAEVLISKQSGLMMLNWEQLMNSPMMSRGVSK